MTRVPHRWQPDCQPCVRQILNNRYSTYFKNDCGHDYDNDDCDHGENYKSYNHNHNHNMIISHDDDDYDLDYGEKEQH